MTDINNDTKQKASHSPGPWVLQKGAFGPSGLIRPQNDDPVCSITGYYNAAGQTIGNARLIAAAPRLLQALERLTSTARTFRNVPSGEQAWTSLDDDALNEAFAAIAEAKGLAA